MGCVQCKDKEAAKLTEERDGSLNQSSGYRYGTDPTPQHYPSFGVTSIPNYNNFHAAGGQGLTVFGGVNSSSHTGTLRTRGGTGKPLAVRRAEVQLAGDTSLSKLLLCVWLGWVEVCHNKCVEVRGQLSGVGSLLSPQSPGTKLGWSGPGIKFLYPLSHGAGPLAMLQLTHYDYGFNRDISVIFNHHLPFKIKVPS